jgi:hypothetical protein
MESLIPKSKTGKNITIGGSLFLILTYLTELRVSVGNIETRLVSIEKRFEHIDQVEQFKKILVNAKD